MKKPKFLRKLTIVDYLIIIIVIIAIVFAFIHITSDDKNEAESTSFDSSTLNKIVEKYLGYYNKGEIVHTSIEGTNSSNNKKVNIKGEIIWMDDDRGSNVKILVKSGNETYLCGLYKDIPNADIYIDKVSLEVNGSKYSNLTEFSINPSNISSIDNLTKGLDNYSNYELTTNIALNELDNVNFQELTNRLYDNGRVSLKLSSTGFTQKITIVRASSDDLTMANNVLGNINGVSDDIVIRVYNCTLDEQKFIENNYDVVNVKTY
ncbi:MAG: adhesin [Methanobrevibacter sp.]|nr:adhesin [Methanobrevibacter sp.]